MHEWNSEKKISKEVKEDGKREVRMSKGVKWVRNQKSGKTLTNSSIYLPKFFKTQQFIIKIRKKQNMIGQDGNSSKNIQRLIRKNIITLFQLL